MCPPAQHAQLTDTAMPSRLPSILRRGRAAAPTRPLSWTEDYMEHDRVGENTSEKRQESVAAEDQSHRASVPFTKRGSIPDTKRKLASIWSEPMDTMKVPAQLYVIALGFQWKQLLRLTFLRFR